MTVGTTATTTQIATELAKMFNGSGTLSAGYAATNFNTNTSTWEQPPEFAEVEALASGSTVILIKDTAGEPFTATVAESTAGDGTLSIAATVTATGPNYVNNTANWDGGALPANGDDVHLDNSAVSLLYGWSDLAAVTVTSWHQWASFTGAVGLPKTNANGYPEYRADFATVGITSLFVGRGEGNGSSLSNYNLGSVQSAIEIFSTGFGTEDGIPALQIKGTHASNALEMHSGSVGLAIHGGETAVFATVKNANGNIVWGPGCTVAAVDTAGGSIRMEKQPTTTLTQRGGETIVIGTSSPTNVDIEEGTCDFRCAGTVTNVNVGERNDALLDCSNDISARTFTNTTLHRNGRIRDPHNTITYTNNVARGNGVSEILAT